LAASTPKSPSASSTSVPSSVSTAKKLDFSILQSLFSKISSTDPEQSPLWYILTTAVLLSFHKERLIGELWMFLMTQIHDQDGQLAAARRLREACLKSSTLVGFPRVSRSSTLSH
jgi:hypothetical protein